MPTEKPAEKPQGGESPEKVLSEFLLRSCHDLKTPLRAIRTSAEILRRESLSADDPAATKHLGLIFDGVRKIDSLADELTGYSLALQIEDSSFSQVSLGALLRGALARLDRELREQNAQIIAGDLPRVCGNSDRLAQLFGLLLRNALQNRSDETLRIQITAEKDGDRWLIRVQDNGVGIEAQWLERIFMPFVRVRGGVEGAGLSLATCRIIVERHGGKLWAESTPGQGSTFFFTLPAADN